MAANLELTLPPWQWQQDLQSATQTARVFWDQNDVISVVNLANRYLWFFLGVIAMFVLVYAWFKLVTARWDEKEMKKVTQTVLWLVIWVIIAIFSFLIVRLAANLF